MEKFTKFFNAAGIGVRLDSQVAFGTNTLEPKFNFFETAGHGNCRVSINHSLSDPPDPKILENENFKKVVDNKTWKISISDSKSIYHYNSEDWFPIPYSVTSIFNADHTRGRSFFKGITEKDYKNLKLPSLSGLATDQALMSRLMVDEYGFLFHSNGVYVKNKTILFSGKSGAGKSTISFLMKKNGGKIFCDDRIIIKKTKSDFYAFGSWIHPGVTSFSGHSGKVDAVFFIEQAKENMITPLEKGSEKYHRALKALVKNFFMAKPWKSTLNLVCEFVEMTPFYSLKFNLTDEVYGIVSRQICQL